MVQKYQSPVRVYKHPFELVMLAYERRFPKCPQMPIVLDCQITADESNPVDGTQRTQRRCKLAVEAPYLFKKLIGLDVVYFVQTNYLDRAARSLSIEATNETYAQRIEIFERCRYYAHPENPHWTCFDQTATLDIRNFFGFEHSMEKMGMKQYTQMTLKGKEIIEHFIEELRSDGITEAPVWQRPPAEPATDDAQRSRQASVAESPQKAGGDSAPAGDASSASVGSRKPSISEYEDMLDADYIRTRLGHLEPLQESRLLELRDVVRQSTAASGDRMPGYPTLLRFLRARDFHVDRAAVMLNDTMRWRRENGIDAMLTEYKRPAVLRGHFPGDWHRCDRDGRPLYILRLGHMDVKGLLKAIGEEGLLALALHICEEGLTLLEAATAERDRPVPCWSLLVDLDGLSMRHLWRPGVKALLRIIETVERNYPETLGRVFIVRAPRVFPIAWTIVSAFIDEHTRTKFLFYGGSDCMNMKDGLEVYIESEVIPDFLGGPCKSLIHEGCLVPKSLYMSTIDEHQATNNASTPASPSNGAKPPKSGSKAAAPNSSLYKCVDLLPGHCYELPLRNDDPKSVLTWDFDVVHGTLQFAVLRTGALPASAGDRSAQPESVLDGLAPSAVDRAEPALLCQAMESVQGSHVMTHTGHYVLQWRCPADAKRTRLMHFHEILSSHNYRGSMSSLQSGVSALSLNAAMAPR